ncbi:MAG: hypothetical protein ACYCTY_09220 [Sulfuricella sp.]
MKIAYCTIASANYLPKVRVLEESLAAHNPGASFHMLLCERPEVCRSLSKEVDRAFISPDEVCPDWLQMAFYYDITEYNTALKPYLLEYLLERGYDAVFYFDPDIEIFGSLAQLESLAENYDLILTPHVCQPMPLDGLKPGIDEIIKAGQFNLGFIGMGDSTEAKKALHWWKEVCLEHCLFDGQRGLFVDQFWAAALPSFIQKFHCLRDSGCNMAYWNVFQRMLGIENGRWMTDCGELKFFHFSGLSENLSQVSRHQNRVTAPSGSPLHEILAGYRERIRNNEWSRYARHAYSFGQYSDGQTISFDERRLFLQLSRVQRNVIGDPFANRIKTQAFLSESPRVARLSLYREYLATVHTKGVISANLAAIRFIAMKLARVGRSDNKKS